MGRICRSHKQKVKLSAVALLVYCVKLFYIFKYGQDILQIWSSNTSSLSIWKATSVVTNITIAFFFFPSVGS